MILHIEPDLAYANELLNQGSMAFAEIERNGMRIDVGYLERQCEEIEDQIRRYGVKLRKTEVYKRMRKLYGERTNLGSRTQLGHVLFEEMGHKCEQRTATGRPKMDDTALSAVNDPFVKMYVKRESLRKIRNTFLETIRRELDERGYIHPILNLHTVKTYRSSCDHPNGQNFPVRDPLQAGIVRRCFIPRKGNVLVEIDYSGNEVRCAAMYNHDPRLINYIEDKTKDMHRDMAAQCYMLKPKQVSKEARYCGKNMFVFPQFYGSYFQQCAPNLWKAIRKLKLNVDGVSLTKHLKSKGIRGLGACDPTERTQPKTFEQHIKDVEEDFWGRRFKVYTEWKERWLELYEERGWFAMLTGFVCRGVYKRNDVINYPIQGTAFHFLLWSLIRLQKEIRRRKMKAKIIVQIHDSILVDLPPGEVEDFLQLAWRIMVVELRKEWDWINVPLEIEAQIARENWYEKEDIEITT